MFISQAWAQAAGGGGGGLDSIQSLLPLVLVFVVFYFLMIRPQQAKAKRHKEMVKNLRRGDRVVTQGGFLATVVKVINDGEVQVELAENVRVRLLRNAVTEVLAKTEPVAGAKDKGKDADAKDGDESAEGSDTAANDQRPSQNPAAPAPQGIAGLLGKLIGGK